MRATPKRFQMVVLIALVMAHAGPFAGAAAELPPASILRVPVSRIRHSDPEPMTFDLREGIDPDQAAVIAVFLNPALRATRDRRGLATAQLIAAGVLPNPQVSYTREWVTGGNTVDTVPTAYSFSAGWEVTSLLPLLPKHSAASANARSVDLDIAWEEWQVAENARLAVYRVIAVEAQLASAREGDRALAQNVTTLKKAVAAHEKTVLDLAAAEATSQDARANTLALEQEFDKQRLFLKKALGLLPDAKVRIRSDVRLPSRLDVPSEEEFSSGIETRRLDLLALQQGYQSQEATVRAAILTAFPKISLGVTKASDTSDVHTTGLSITVDVPLFDRNQGVIATERSTRQKLLDEYNNRIFEARSDIAVALADIRSLNRQIAAAEAAVPALERLVATAQTAAEQRNVDVLAYYDARNDLIQKRVQIFKLKQQLVEARAAVEIASGRFLQTKTTR